MFRNYFITAFRYIIRNKIQSFIQVISLAIGITAAILIGLYVDHELKYDKFNEKLDRIYRLEYGNMAAVPSAIGHEIKEIFTEVENVVRITRTGTGDKFIKYVSGNDENTKKEVQLKTNEILCDSTIFDVFTLPFIQGDPKTALRDGASVVITESIAKSIFGNKNPIGETVEINTQIGTYTITGVIKDVENFHIDFDILVSLESRSLVGELLPNPSDLKRLNSYGGGNSQMTYLLLPHPHDQTRVENIINAFFSDKMKISSDMYSEGSVFSLRPLKDIYFSSPLNRERGILLHGNLKLLKILVAISAIILVLACINYINLTTARSSLRAREVGVRKVMGSQKSRLMFQFMVESVLISLVSFLLAITIVQVLLPTFIQMTGYELSLERLFHPQTFLFAAAGIILLGAMAGIYPAVYMTTFQPVTSLKGEQLTGVKSNLFRRILFTFQFTISVVLIIGVFAIIKQLKYMKSADIGFDKELVVEITPAGMLTGRGPEIRPVFKESLLKHPNITKVAWGITPANTSFRHSFPFFIEYNGIQIKPDGFVVDPDYFDLLDIKILEGRNFSWDRVADSELADDGLIRCIINETAMREFELESPVGVIFNSEQGVKGEIIGVVEDFHFFSLHQNIEPTLFRWQGFIQGLNIKILPYDIPGTIKYIKKEYESLLPDNMFWYSFLDDTYDQQYASDERLSKIISNFAIVAILIACLGLFGLSTFMAARRTKEIGIRKAMGASVRTVFLLLAREFAIWVTLSVMIACPLAWIIMNRWLQSFAYRTNINVWIFILSIVIAFAIAFITVAWQSLKTARTNPVEALRYE